MRIGHDEMRRRHNAHVRLHHRPHAHILGGGNRLRHIRTSAQQIHAQFPRGQSLLDILGPNFLVLRKTGKVKQSDG